MMTQPELMSWLQTIPRGHYVAVDDGGLTLVALDPKGETTGAYLEIGGFESDDPEPEMPWCKWCKSYHVVPKDRAHHRALKCFAPWRPPPKPERAEKTIGIVADARTLGVTREHLYRVLNGRRHSKSLTRRYWLLQKEKRK